MRITRKLLSIFIIFAVITCSLFALGCTEVDDETITIENESEQKDTETISLDEIINIEWQWSGLIETLPASQSVVPDPENYTLVFLPDETYSIKADCNLGSGNYILEGNNLTLQPGPMTLAYCGPESLDNQYVSLLGNVTAAELDDDQLVLFVGDMGDKMLFINGGLIEQ